ncbi:hypothetical protein F5Y03DRAFT_353720 [Xylaria venustula]|nr:hypothetical protein F5Y03DRAFT_353720 [Xylaria venustula]
MPQSYEKLLVALKATGCEVHVPRLPTCNEARPANTDLASDTELIRNYVEGLVRAGRTVIVIGQSYGGQVCSNALHGLGEETRFPKRLVGGVSRLVYLAGYALPEGFSTVDKFKEFGNIEDLPLAFNMADDGSAIIRDPEALYGINGHGTSDEDIEDIVVGVLKPVCYLTPGVMMRRCQML